MEKFIFGTFVYEYSLIRQERKTLSLTVTPELKIVLKSPFEADGERIEAFLKRKWFWLEKQLSFFKRYHRKLYEKEYVSGEGFLYLGRQHKLIVKSGAKDSVGLLRGELCIETTKAVANGAYNKKLLESWFKEKAEEVFKARFKEMLERFNYVNIPLLAMREMSRRWGSFLSDKKIFLNPKLIHTAKECIDYVIVHELCHLKYRNHDKDFWQLLAQKYPKWEKVKEKLEIIGGRCD